MEAAVAAIGAVAVVAAAWFAYRSSRLNKLEDRVDNLAALNELLWRYNRQLIDHIYRGEPPPPPPAPDELVALLGAK